MPSGSVAVAASAIVAGAVKMAPSVGLVRETTGTEAQLRIALSALSRPFVTVIPVIDGITSTLLRIAAFNCVVFRLHADSTSTADPDTCGVAIEVPLRPV